MKKRLFIVVLAVVMVVCLVGCGTTHQEATGQTESKNEKDFGGGYFTVITKRYDEDLGNCYIIYANDTKVKYLIFDSGMYQFSITPLYNADGTLQIYEESED